MKWKRWMHAKGGMCVWSMVSNLHYMRNIWLVNGQHQKQFVVHNLYLAHFLVFNLMVDGSRSRYMVNPIPRIMRTLCNHGRACVFAYRRKCFLRSRIKWHKRKERMNLLACNVVVLCHGGGRRRRQRRRCGEMRLTTKCVTNYRFIMYSNLCRTHKG